jgi:hypothetical protein
MEDRSGQKETAEQFMRRFIAWARQSAGEARTKAEEFGEADLAAFLGRQ